jgi:dTDP-4-amino-4,6-dideoxygalactose transaminase
MTEVQSQIGLCELARLDTWNLTNRRRNGRSLAAALGDHPAVLHTPVDTRERVNSYWWAPFVVDIDKLKCDTKQFVAALGAEGVPAYRVLWPEMYLEHAFVERNGFGSLKYPFEDPNAREIDYSAVVCHTARYLAARTVSLFTHPVYGDEHMQRYIDAFEKVADYYMN